MTKRVAAPPSSPAARSKNAADIRLKRAYDAPTAEDGARFLIDGLWARGVTKVHLKLTAWLKDLGSSAELRRFFDHKEAHWKEFEVRYRAELASKGEALTPLLEAARKGTVTLVYAAKDREHNNAVVLKRVLEEHLASDT